MEYSRKLILTLALAFAMAAAVATAQNSPADYLNPHNTARAAVGVGPVSWDATVAAYAQSYAEKRRSDCNLTLSSGTKYGENLFWGSAGSDWSAADAVKLWLDDKQYYDHGSNTCAAGKDCTQYTQVVWNTSTAIGCARVVCVNGGVFITCNYNPPGNVPGQSPY